MRWLSLASPLALLLVSALGGACKGSDTASGGAGGAAVSPVGKVVGAAVDTYFTDTGRATAPDTGTIEAVFEAGGEAKTVQGAIGSDGSFLLDVPEGATYAWHYVGSTVWQIAKARTMDLGVLVSGRAGLARPELATALAFTVSGLVPWQDGSAKDPKQPTGDKLPTDHLQLASLGGGAYVALSDDLPAETPIARDAVTAKGTIDLSLDPFASLLRGSEGDVAYVTQLVGHEEGTFSWNVVERAGKATAPDMADGKPAKLSVKLAALDLVEHELAWKRSEFAELLGDVPAATTQEARLDVFIEPDAKVSSSGGFFADLLTASSPSVVHDDPEKDVSFKAKIGNPFPAGMVAVASANLTFRVEGLLPGSDTTKGLTGTIAVTVALGGKLAPTLGPPRNVTVSGFPGIVIPAKTTGGGGAGQGGSGAGGSTGTGTATVLEWEAPALGAATHYSLTLRKVDKAGPSSLAGRVITRGTSVTIPDGLLEKGQYYYVRIAAVADPLWSEETPFRHAVKTASAEAVTPIFSP